MIAFVSENTHLVYYDYFKPWKKDGYVGHQRWKRAWAGHHVSTD